MSPNDAPDGAENTEAQQREQYIPRSRFDQVLGEMKDERAARQALEQKLNDLLKKDQDREAAALAEQGKFKELADQRAAEVESLKPFKAEVDKANAAMQKLLDAAIANLPEDQRSAVPSKYSVADQLDWIAENQARLLRPPAPGTDAGKQGDPGHSVKLSPEEEDVIRKTGISREKYIARKQQLSGG